MSELVTRLINVIEIQSIQFQRKQKADLPPRQFYRKSHDINPLIPYDENMEINKGGHGTIFHYSPLVRANSSINAFFFEVDAKRPHTGLLLDK